MRTLLSWALVPLTYRWWVERLDICKKQQMQDLGDFSTFRSWCSFHCRSGVQLGELAFFLGTTENDKSSNNHHLNNILLSSGSRIEPFYLADADGRRAGFLKRKGTFRIRNSIFRVRTFRIGTFLTPLIWIHFLED